MVLSLKKLGERVVWLRIAQLMINEEYRKDIFKVPIHLALGHEALAVALDSILSSDDRLVLTHRNAAYNLIRCRSLRAVRGEYMLKRSGLAGGKLGSMNLSNPARGIPYASSILGNSFPVGAGVALALQQKGRGIAVSLGGDGSMEEGTFYETITFAKAQKLPLIVLIENNEWSMATRISERRAPINLKLFAKAIGVSYVHLSGNNVYRYAQKLKKIHAAEYKNGPVLVEAGVSTLGDWVKQEEKGPRLINYHSGPAPTVNFDGSTAIVRRSSEDPLQVLEKKLSAVWLTKSVSKQYRSLLKEPV